MSYFNYRAGRKKVIGVFAFVVTLACWGRVASAAQGDTPLEPIFLPYDTEISGRIPASDYVSDYYEAIVPSTGRFIARLYDIDLSDANDDLHLTLYRWTHNSVGTQSPEYFIQIAWSEKAGEADDEINISGLTRGIYFLEVSPHKHNNWEGATYKVRTEFTVFPPLVTDDVGNERHYAIPVVNEVPIECTLSGGGDIDYFECQFPYNMNFAVAITEISEGGNVDVEVYTAWGVLVGSGKEPANSDEFVYLPDLIPGQYFIKLFGEGTPRYVLTATYKFIEAPPNIIDDVGNTQARAMPLLPDNPSVFCLEPYDTDQDCFCVYQPADGIFSAQVYDMFFYLGDQDLRVQLLDEYGNIIGESDNPTNPGSASGGSSPIPENIELWLPRGQYFLTVYGKGSLDWQGQYRFLGGIYTIKVTTSSLDVGNSFNQAMQIHGMPYPYPDEDETRAYPYVGLIDTPGDVDFFQVVLKDRGAIHLVVDRMLHSNVDVQLFDANRSLLRTGGNACKEEPDTIDVGNLGPGAYFVKVYSPVNGEGQYRLTPTVETATSPISDDIGDSADLALPLGPYHRVNAYIWDEGTRDVFSFGLGAAVEWARIRVHHQHVWHPDDDIYLVVYDSEENELGRSDNDRMEDELVELEQPAAGKYFCEIIPQGHYTWTGQYAMGVVQYCITVETPSVEVPTAELFIPLDITGAPGERIYVPVILDNTQPDEISSMSLGVQFDPDILQAEGVCYAELTFWQWSAELRYSGTDNSVSALVSDFATQESGELVLLIFKIKLTAASDSSTPLSFVTSVLNGYVVPGTDGLVTVKSVDGDGDGMQAFWEEEHTFSDSRPEDAAEDADNDGLTNLKEFENQTDPHNPDTDGDGMKDGDELKAGTDPNDGQSWFRITGIARCQGSIRITWSSLKGRSYRILRTTDLLTEWTPVSEAVEGLLGCTSWDDTTFPERTFFYKAEVQALP